MHLRNYFFPPIPSLFPFFFIIFIFMLLDCKSDNPPSHKIDKPTDSIPQIKEKGFNIINYEVLFQKIVALQTKVSEQPDNRFAMEKLLFEAYRVEDKQFYCVGKASANPKLPMSVQLQAMKRAAQLTAYRWVLYLSAWQHGNFVSLNSSLSGELPPFAPILFEKMTTDTLYLLVSVPSIND